MTDQIELTDKTGALKLRDVQVAKVIDCIFCMIASSIELKSVYDIHLELFRCNLYVQQPGLRKLLKYLKDNKYIDFKNL
jgi:hypothetical protein